MTYRDDSEWLSDDEFRSLRLDPAFQYERVPIIDGEGVSGMSPPGFDAIYVGLRAEDVGKVTVPGAVVRRRVPR